MKKLFITCLLALGLGAVLMTSGAVAQSLEAPAEAEAVVEAVAEEAAAPAIDSGNTAWMITATALVLFMTLPGLALFYGGLVRAKNVLTILVQCFALAAIMTVLWVVYGYSVAFDSTGMSAGTVNFQSFFGGLSTWPTSSSMRKRRRSRPSLRWSRSFACSCCVR
jgi:hypothetical protein